METMLKYSSEEQLKNEESVIDEMNYRDIAKVMTGSGFVMNHSSVRNYVIRVMERIVTQYGSMHGIELTQETINRIARSARFQHDVGEILEQINV